MNNNTFDLKVGKRYRVKVGAYLEFATWRYGKILSTNNHSPSTVSYFFHESVMHEKYPRKEYFGGYIWSAAHRSSSNNILRAEEIILFDTVNYLYSVAPKNPVCQKLQLSND
jgi:hypothetical protein